MNAMRDSIERTHSLSVASDKMVEKTLKKTQKELQIQLRMVKETVAKLSDVMLEEFESIRDDYQADLNKYTVPLYQRM